MTHLDDVLSVNLVQRLVAVMKILLDQLMKRVPLQLSVISLCHTVIDSLEVLVRNNSLHVFSSLIEVKLTLSVKEIHFWV